MNMNILPDIIEIIGELLIAAAVLKVHSRVLSEHKIDKEVLTTIKFEKIVVILGITFLVASLFLRIYIN